jgi:FkbM family methyltransferase
MLGQPNKFFALMQKSRQVLRDRLPLRNFDHFLKSCNRIVHVGANTGQERELYCRRNLEVVWVEPIPAVYEQLARNIQPYPKQSAVQALLTDRPGDIVELNISNNSGASSSIFDFALHRDIWPEVDYIGRMRFRTETLDGLVERGTIRLPVDAIVIDTQGADLLVLKGAEAVLRQASWVKVEAADFESYRGGATLEAIEAFLKKFSLRCVKKARFARHPSGGGYYDLLFKRVGRSNCLDLGLAKAR